MNKIEYTWEEITLFATAIISYLGISVYFCCKRASLNDYVSGSGTMGIWPLSMSMVATSLSSITFGYANEIYQYGPHIMFDVVGIGAMWIASWVLIPVFHPLKLISLSEHIHSTVVTYSTALFVSQISGIGFMKCFLVIIISCYVFTAISGFKGVVWTDTLQAIAMFVSLAILAVIGFKEAGGFGEVYTAALEGDRLSFDWSLDLTKRFTVWSAFVSLSLQRVSYNSILAPFIYQRYVALPTQSDARKTSFIHSIGMVFIVSFTFIIGYIMFALFKSCDPVLSGKASKYDQVLPYFVKHIGERVRFARSVYIIGYISAAVSTLSTEMNTYAVTLYKDFIHDRFNKPNDEGHGQRLIQFVGLILVSVSILLVQVLQHSGSVTDLASLSTFPITIYFSIIFIGVYMPWINSKGVIWATLLSLAAVFWISIEARVEHSRGINVYQDKPMSINGCLELISTSVTNSSSTRHDDSNAFILFKMTPFLQPTMGMLLMLLISTLVTFITGSNDLKRLDKRLLSPWVHRFLPGTEDNLGVMVPLNVLSEEERRT